MFEPREYQKPVIEKFKDEPCGGLFMDTGTGKTCCTIHLARHKYDKHKGILKTLILCPTMVIRNWKKELGKFSNIPPQHIGVIEETDWRKRIGYFNNPDYHIISMNYEALRNHNVRRACKDWNAQIVIADESHKIKAHKKPRRGSLRGSDAWNAVEVSRDAFYRYILTATPYANNEMDIFMQFLFMDNGESFGRDFWAFRNYYFIDQNRGFKGKQSYFPKWEVNASLQAEFKAKAQKKTIRMKKEDCLDLPDLVEQTIDIPLGKDQKRHYDEVRRDLITWLDAQEDNPLVIKNALTKILRLSEITSGFMTLEDGTKHVFEDVPRLDYLVEQIESIGKQKALVFCTFRQNYKDIAGRLEKKKIKCVSITGEQTMKQKLDTADKFMDSDAQVCIANAKSGGVGIDALKGVPYTFFYNINYNYVDFEQARGRNYRSGSIDYVDKVTHYHYISPKTIDEIVYDAVMRKKKVASSLLDVRKILTI